MGRSAGGRMADVSDKLGIHLAKSARATIRRERSSVQT
jgi:hypothetical protein